jgi:signal transduction histidine kinase
MAGEVARGDLTVRVPETGKAEIGDLERSFNSMAGSLERNRAELTASRARIVAAGDAARRRIERDLHDGTQQRLVTLSLQLRMIEADVPEGHDSLRRRLSWSVREMTDAVRELREISRGIHPAVLTKGGIVPALATLARRSSLPVDVRLDLGRALPPTVDVAVYYVVSEALTNAARHANASRVSVELGTDDTEVRLSIRDDGVGGADAARGSGLVGLHDRVEALGGAVEVVSPVNAGTTLLVRIPTGRE